MEMENSTTSDTSRLDNVLCAMYELPSDNRMDESVIQNFLDQTRIYLGLEDTY